jgi:hypothetical protein
LSKFSATAPAALAMTAHEPEAWLASAMAIRGGATLSLVMTQVWKRWMVAIFIPEPAKSSAVVPALRRDP